MDDGFKPLDRDDDVLSFDNTTLKVGQLREELRQKFYGIAQDLLDYGRLRLQINQYSRPTTIFGRLNYVNWMCFPNDGIDCEVLMLGANSWQKGKLRIQSNLEFLPILEKFKYIDAKMMSNELSKSRTNTSEIFKIQVVLEFLPDKTESNVQSEISPPESPLDDLRQMLNQQNQQ